MGRCIGLAGCAIAVLLGAGPAAGDADDTNVDRPRVRAGVGFVFGIVEVPYTSLRTDPTVLGVAGRVGVQVSDRLAVFDQLNLTAYWLQLRDAIFLEWTPSDYFSVGAGPAIEWLGDIGGSADSDWSLGGSLRLALHIPYSRGVHHRRRALSFSVEASPSYAFAGWNTYSSSGFQFGVLVGVGLEWY